MALADAAGIKRSAMSNYWPGKRPFPLESFPRLAATLDTSVDYLLLGKVTTAGTVVDAVDADWITTAEYDLREMTDESLGPAIHTAPIRRDWLYSLVRTSTGLWLTRLLSDYPPAGLTEGSLVICRTVRPEDLAEGHVCLWRVAERVVVGRFSHLPDEMLARSSAGGTPGAGLPANVLASYRDPALGVPVGDIVVPPSAVAAGRYHLVGRILGAMIRPI